MGAQHILRAAALHHSGGAVFDPATLSPYWWYRPRDLDGSLADGAAVASLTDASGNLRVIEQGTSAQRPTLEKVELDGLSIMRHDRTADSGAGQTIGNFNAFPTALNVQLTAPCEIWIAAKLRSLPSGDGNGQVHGLLGGQGGNSCRFVAFPSFYVPGPPSSGSVDALTDFGSFISGVATSLWTNWTLWRVRIDDASSFIHANGSSIATGDTGTGTMNGVWFGSFVGGSKPSDLDWAEAIAFNSNLSPGDASNLISYFDATFPSIGL